MIRAINMSPKEFARKYPPGGKGKESTHTPSKSADYSGSSRRFRHPILNDIPTAATSCLIYKYEDLKSAAGDCTYPIPETQEFEALRELKTLEAVVKLLPDGTTVFSHMLVSPGDVSNLFGEEFMREMKAIQRHVC